MTSWTSIEARVQRTWTPGKTALPDPNIPGTEEDRYVETASGFRYFDHILKVGDGQTSHGTDYFDGTKAAGVRYDPDDSAKQTQVTLDRAFGTEGRAGTSHRPRS